MEAPTREVVIDVGGGKGECFAEKARAEPNKMFLILEPERFRLEGKPPNLHIIQWRSDRESELPLKPSSVNEVNINFLAGEMFDKEGEGHTHTADFPEWEGYRKLLQSLKRVLKNGALVRIIDVQNNIGNIRKLLKEEGYGSISQPTRLKDEDRTDWSKRFFSLFRQFGKPEEESFILPVEVEAKWQLD